MSRLMEKISELQVIMISESVVEKRKPFISLRTVPEVCAFNVVLLHHALCMCVFHECFPCIPYFALTSSYCLQDALKELKTDLDRAKKGKPPLKDADGKQKRNLTPEA